jgi:two-component system chemotaxis response regulator CheB
MGADGAKGLLKMKESGSRTIGQNEASCIVYGMPKEAFKLGAVEKELHLNKIAQGVMELL